MDSRFQLGVRAERLKSLLQGRTARGTNHATNCVARYAKSNCVRLRTNPTVQRILAFSSAVISSIVLLLALFGIILVWVVNWQLGNAVIDLSVGVEKTAQALQRGVQRVDTTVGEARAQVQAVQGAILQISQNVGDEGLVRTLLPESREERLDAAIQGAAQTLDAVLDTLGAARDLYRAINRIPGINLPEPSEERINGARELAATVQNDVLDLQDSIARVRQREANAIARAAEPAAKLDARLGEIESRLDELDGALTSIQERAKQMRRTIPILLTIFAVILTMVQAWIAWSQIVMFRLAWQRWQAIPNP